MMYCFKNILFCLFKVEPNELKEFPGHGELDSLYTGRGCIQIPAGGKLVWENIIPAATFPSGYEAFLRIQASGMSFK